MRLGTIAFLIGIVIFQQLPGLPDSRWALLLGISVPLSIWLKPLRFFFWLMNGFLLTLVHASIIFSSALSPELEGQDLLVEGLVTSIPEQHEHGVRFQFEIVTPSDSDPVVPLPKQIRLSWYGPTSGLYVGQRWQLLVRLKRPHGFMNPGGFDYEAWLYRHEIRATGYVRKSDQNKLLGESGAGYALDRWRQDLANDIDEAIAKSRFTGIIKALAIGQRDGISAEQWQILLRTGTNHLVAISGLHVGLVAGLLFFLVRWAWSRSSRLVIKLPSQKAAALAAIAAALAYAALAGFSIPTQRALVMVCVFMVSILLQRHHRPSQGLFVALLLVLIIDPLAVMDAGFWLSFAAVATILFGMSSRMLIKSLWWRWGRIHWVIGIALVPLTLLLFQKASLISPLANFIAVPVISLLVVPLVLLGTLLLKITPIAGGILLTCADLILNQCWSVLSWLSGMTYAQTYHSLADWWIIFPATMGVLWLLAPRGWPARWLGIVWIAAVFLLPHSRPQEGEALFTLLDVGQGLAAAVQTSNHILLFDTGPRFSETFDTGSAVIIPFLRSRGLGKIDMLVVSHGDSDHIGGARSILAQMTVDKVLTSVPEKFETISPESCQSGQNWHWDGVDFTMLHPPPNSKPGENDSSCVLKVSNSGGSVLLTGDIEKKAEKLLLADAGDVLESDVLVVPHHGSKTSSTTQFIDAVAPKYAFFPVGYRNRFRLPRQEVVSRYTGKGIKVMQSGHWGALEIKLGNGDISAPESYRHHEKRYWRYFPPNLNGKLSKD